MHPGPQADHTCRCIHTTALAKLRDGLRLSVGEVAAVLSVNGKTVTRWADEGRISCLLLPSGHRRFEAADVLEFVKPAPVAVPAGGVPEALLRVGTGSRFNLHGNPAADGAYLRLGTTRSGVPIIVMPMGTAWFSELAAAAAAAARNTPRKPGSPAWETGTRS